MPTALLIGSTGLVGKHCLTLLLESEDYDSVITLSRRKSGLEHPKLVEEIVDFEKLELHASRIKADHIFSALGTTIRKAGSQINFHKIDFEYQLETAAIAKRNGASKHILISSAGASATSSIFYSREKGLLEEAIGKLNYNTQVVLRPSILLGDRSEMRAGEAIGQWAAKNLEFLFTGPFKKYKGVTAETVAKAMVTLARTEKSKRKFVENLEIFEVANTN
jgi:uncharacterized protein YbjT (DUF2867 family)